jgi:hypothetical protein
MVARQRLPELLQGPPRCRVSGGVLLQNSSCDHKYVKHAKSGVTTTKKSHATITFTWLWTKVSQRCLGSVVRTGPSRRYFPTVRGDTRIPSFRCNSLAIRSSPKIGLSACHRPDQLSEVLWHARSSRWFGLPAPERRITRPVSGSRTPAEILFAAIGSAYDDQRQRPEAMCKALKTDACDMNAQDCTLPNVTVARFHIAELFVEHSLGSGVAIHSNGDRQLVAASECLVPAFGRAAQYARDAH